LGAKHVTSSMVAGQTVRDRRQEWTRNENLSMKFTLLTLAACTTLTAPVFAADMAPAIAPGPPVFASNSWEGFYFGGHVGYAFGTSSYLSNPPGLSAAGQVGLYGMDGQFGPLAAGLQAGYNHVTPSGLMFGFEADFSFPDKMNSNLPIAFSATGPSEVTDNIEIFGALRGRIGYAFGDWLIYGTGGFAYDRDLATSKDTLGDVDRIYFWRPGWTAGAGVEVRLTSNWSARLEYAFSDFARVGIFFHWPASITIPTSSCGRRRSA
jgi:high affinity Mn2+ porin